jgi:hypothetical protein
VGNCLEVQLHHSTEPSFCFELLSFDFTAGATNLTEGLPKRL